MTLQNEFSEAVRALINTQDKAKYNISLGFFNGYSTVIQDNSGLRYCNLKLHNKTADSQDINLFEVPLFFPGCKNTVFDFQLVTGDELMVFFSDRSLEQWKDSMEPQQLKNPVKDSINHAFCFPISSHHTYNELNLPVNTHVKIPLTSGKKIQIGLLDTTGTKTELLDILYQVIEILLQADTNGDTLPGVSGKGNNLTQLQTALALITDIT